MSLPLATPPASETAPDVTVIVITHDAREEVLSCLDSVQHHAGRLSVEVVLIDNGSTDGTAAAVSRRFPSVDVVALETNEGVPARNHGLRRARGRHRMFLDSDARLTPGALGTLVAALDASPEVGLVAPRLVYPDETLQLSTRRFPPVSLPVLRRPPLAAIFEHRRTVRHHLMVDDPHDRRRRVEYAIGACQLFRADAQEAAGEIDEHIWFGPDDADWCFAIREAGWDIVYVPDAVVVHDYQRSTAAAPFSLRAWHHLVAFARFQWKWRHRARALRTQGAAMDAEARRARS